MEARELIEALMGGTGNPSGRRRNRFWMSSRSWRAIIESTRSGVAERTEEQRSDAGDGNPPVRRSGDHGAHHHLGSGRSNLQ
jgi:hypothetical protein